MENNAMLINQEATNLALRRKARKAKIGKIAANAFIYFVLLLMYLPIIYITIFSFTDSPIAGKWVGFSFNNYAELFDYVSAAVFFVVISITPKRGFVKRNLSKTTNKPCRKMTESNKKRPGFLIPGNGAGARSAAYGKRFSRGLPGKGTRRGR